jgi:glycopeptide antibiotics resistance protein
VLSGTDVRFSRGLVLLWVAPALVALFATLVTIRARPDTRRTVRRGVDILVIAYACGVVAITLYPFRFDVEAGRILDRGNWLPFGGTLGFLTSDNSLQVQVGSRDFLANIALFAPIGLLLGARTRRIRDVVLVGVLLVLMAFALEVVQGLTVSERTLDIDDAIAGSLGALGAVLLGAMLPGDATTARTRHL